jgi:hypothetical protein
MNKHMHKVRQKIALKRTALENGAVQLNTAFETSASTHQDCTTVETKLRNAP